MTTASPTAGRAMDVEGFWPLAQRINAAEVFALTTRTGDGNA